MARPPSEAPARAGRACAARTCGCCCVCCAHQWALAEDDAPAGAGLDHDPTKLRWVGPLHPAPSISRGSPRAGPDAKAREGCRWIERFFFSSFYEMHANPAARRVIFAVFFGFFVAGAVRLPTHPLSLLVPLPPPLLRPLAPQRTS